MIKGLAHVAFVAQDMDKTLDFYVNKLGFKHAFSLPDQDGKPWIEYIKVADGEFLEFFYSNGKPAQTCADGFLHICLQVDDAEATCAQLISRGVTMDIMPKQGCDLNIQFWAKDPNGYPIEFMQIAPQSPQANS